MKFVIFILSLFLLRSAFSKTSPSQMPAVKACKTSQLIVKEFEREGAMGGVHSIVYQVNSLSSAPCFLNKAPVANASSINSHHKIVITAIAPTSHQIQISNKQAGWFSILYNNGGAGYVGMPCPRYQVEIKFLGQKLESKDSIVICNKRFEVTPLSLHKK